MAVRKLKDGIYSVGAIDWDRRLFDELIPLPDGTTYNTYIVKGEEKTALLDTVDPVKKDELIGNLKSLGVEKIDYIIAHHAEQDHSGSIPDILSLYPEAKVVTNEKCKSFLMDLLHIPEDKFIVVNDGDTLSLGGRTLKFIFTPWVHWPETMVTYLTLDNILFTCDFFGSHYASSDLFVKDKEKVLEDAKRYYAEIMMPFRHQIKKNLEKIKDLKIDIIAPSHGLIYDEPELIINAYKEWISDEVKNMVLIPYVSMHGSTLKMVNYLVDALIKRGIEVKPFNLSKTDIGELAMALVDTATVVVGTPTVLAGPHPSVVYATYLVGVLRPKTKFISIIGSFGWGGKTVDTLKGLIPALKVEIIEPLLIKGDPGEEDFKLIDEFADKILSAHKKIGLL
ncbi:MAG TPA: FprA family A-type flavoprotein [Firmicutes bacterium]|nr:FprA family A-type flavoprotein [Bacillota bacterium]